MELQNSTSRRRVCVTLNERLDLFRISIHIIERCKTIYIAELNELVGVIITLLHQTAFIPRNYDV